MRGRDAVILCLFAFGFIYIGWISRSPEPLHEAGGTSVDQDKRKIRELEKAVEALQHRLGLIDGDLGVSPPPQKSSRKVEEKNLESKYGGVNDPAHLGGFTEDDKFGQSPALWTFLMKTVNVRSVIDLGCGKGISTKFFMDRGADVLCVEGSEDAVAQSLLPRDKVILHDVYEGQWWPDRTFDLLWAVEFLEHIGRHKMDNYLPIMKKAGILFVTGSKWGGYHHVEVHREWWWIARFEGYGFKYSERLTVKLRAIAGLSQDEGFVAQHLQINSMVFLNPAVLRLPEHHHLFGDHGCFLGKNGGTIRSGQPCKEGAGEGVTNFDILPENFLPVFTEDTKWDEKAAKIWHDDGIDKKRAKLQIN